MRNSDELFNRADLLTIYNRHRDDWDQHPLLLRSPRQRNVEMRNKQTKPFFLRIIFFFFFFESQILKAISSLSFPGTHCFPLLGVFFQNFYPLFFPYSRDSPSHFLFVPGVIWPKNHRLARRNPARCYGSHLADFFGGTCEPKRKFHRLVCRLL